MPPSTPSTVDRPRRLHRATAATRVDRCIVVASLLATDPHKSDTFGKELTPELDTTVRREREERPAGW